MLEKLKKGDIEKERQREKSDFSVCWLDWARFFPELACQFIKWITNVERINLTFFNKILYFVFFFLFFFLCKIRNGNILYISFDVKYTLSTI